jgi:predicted DNA-binding transcriptional regulator YafY
MAARRLGLAAGPAAVEGALAKLERALPPDVRQRVAAVQRTLTIDAARPPDAPATADVLTLSEAAHGGRQVRLSYTSAQGEASERVVEPYGLVQFGRRWYLPAWCHLRGGPRLFRLDRIGAIEPLGERFAPPPDFDPIAFVQDALAAAPGCWKVEALLATTLEAVRTRVAPHEAVLEPADGGVALRFNVEDLDWAARYLIGLGFPFVVAEPPELRAVLRGIAAGVAAAAEDPVP